MKKADTLRELPGRFITLCTAAFALCMLAASVSALHGVSAKSALGLALSLAVFALAAFSACLAARRLPERALPALVVLAALFVRSPFALLPDAEQVSDFALLYDSAAALAGGDASALSGEYFLHWGYQVPFVLYEALVIRLGGGVGALRVLNLLWTAGASGLVYLFARKFAGPRAGFAAGLLYAVYPGALILAGVLTNQHISLFFCLLGMWLIVERGPFAEGGTPVSRALYGAAAGLSLSLAGLMRPESVLALASTVVTAAVLLIARHVSFRRLILPLAAVFAAYFALNAAASAAVSASGIAPGGIGNSRPEWKFVIGLDTESGGTYSEANEYILDIADDAERREAAGEAIRASLEGCDDLAGFFWGKLEGLWGSMEDLSFVTGGLPMESALIIAERAAFLLAAALAALGCVAALRRRAGAAELMDMCALSAAFICYLFIEIQPRYRYGTVPFIFILAAGAGRLRYGHRGEKRV